MLGKNNIESELNIDIAISNKMESKIIEWGNVYENKAPWLNENVKSLELGSSIANEFTRLILTEMKSELTGGQRADYLQIQYNRVLAKLPDNLEIANAKGGGVLKPYVKGNQIYVDFIQQGLFFPIAFDDTGKTTSIVFLSQKTQGDYIYTRLEYHRLIGTDYHISNTAYKSRDKSFLGKRIDLTEVNEWKDIEQEVKIENVEKPLFAYYKPPIANNIDTKSPLGMSVFAKAVNLIKDADEQYGRTIWEYEASEKAVYASIEALKPKKEVIRDGEKKRAIWETPKLKDRLFKAIDLEGKNGEGFFEDYSPEIRDEAFWRGLNKILERIEFNVGLAYGTLSEPAYSDKTATEIKTSKQRSYVTVSRMQDNLQTALEDLLYAMNVLATLYNLSPSRDYQATFDWGDNVLTDTEREQTLQMQEVNANLRSRLKYIMFRYGMTEKQAQEELDRIQQEKMNNQEAFGFNRNINEE